MILKQNITCVRSIISLACCQCFLKLSVQAVGSQFFGGEFDCRFGVNVVFN